MDPIQKALEEAEIQAHKDKYQALTPAQLRDLLYDTGQFAPPQEQDLPLQAALVSLLTQGDPAPQTPTPAPPGFLTAHKISGRERPRPGKRLLLVAAVLAALLALTAAYAVQHWGLFLNP